jgi:hypothetical protein
MAQPQRTRPRAAEREEVANLERWATEAAGAFREYISGGDPARRQAFYNIYNRSYGGATLHDNSVFMNKLFGELDRIGNDPQVHPILDAFKTDRGRLFGFLWSNPAHFTDFIDTVFNIRSVLDQGAARDEAVARLVQQVNSAPRAVRADTPVGRVRESMRGGMSVEDAARAELERTSREDAAARYGERLTAEVIDRAPRLQARRAAVALRDFILTGNSDQRDTFRRIFDSNTSRAFDDAFLAEFRSRIHSDAAIGPVTHAWTAHHSGGIDPNEFAVAVANIYRAASTGTVEEVERLRQSLGTDVVDPLLRIVALGMARRATNLLREVLESGDATASSSFGTILNGRMASVVGGSVRMTSVEQNDVFWNEFSTLYRAEIAQNSRLATLVRSFGRNILPIAIRDIYSELARPSPDMSRLNSEYGPDLVRLVASGAGSLSWLARSEADINSEITRRATAEDPAARRLRSMHTTFSKGRALPEVYTMLVEERMARRTLSDAGILELVESNFDALSYLDADPAAVQSEIDRRAGLRQPDAAAVRLRAAFPTEAGTRLSEAYRRLKAIRQRRAQLVQSYGQDFVDLVSQNMQNLQWVLRPVEEIESEMRSRRDDPVVRGIYATSGYSVGTLAQALREIYTGAGGSQRTQLEQRYGTELVQFVQTNRASLNWLSGDTATVERALQDRTDQQTRDLRSRWLYGYSPVQLVTAISRARAAISRGGMVRDDARDAYGTIFVAPVVSRQAVATRSHGPEAAQANQQAILARWGTIERELEDLERQLRYDVLTPARALLTERIRRWRQENLSIKLAAQSSQDPQELQRIEQRQRTLWDGLIRGAELRQSVEMAFSMIHLAETGADVSSQPIITGITPTDIDIGQLRRLNEWYRSLAGTGKQEVVGEVVSAVLRRADSGLFDFIVSMDEPGYFQALTRTYAVTQGRGADTRLTMTQRYGEPFVNLMESLSPNLHVLDSPAATARSLRMERNDIYASIVVRCYRALASPHEGENRDTMVRLFGEDFVRAVEQNRARMSSLGGSDAGIAEVRALPEAVRTALWHAYPSAYSRSIGSLLRTYRHQDERMFYDMAAVYAVVHDRPPTNAPRATIQAFDQRVQELYATYGREFVRAVADNMDQLGFLESPTASIRDVSGLPAPVLETLRSSFERGPGPGRANFMQNFTHLSERLPRVYLQLRSSLIFSNATDQLPVNFRQAVELYRQEFGSNDYLFGKYINIDLLSRNIQRLARRYGVTLPPFAADGISSPEELARFLATEAGRDLITAGRTFYDQMESEYLRARTDTNYHPETGDYTDANVTNLRNELSILDALYMGVALERISGTDSAMTRASAQSVMNALLVIEHRDPYLVGPFLLQVLPAILSVAQDERTLVAGLTAFTEIFTQRYGEGTREIAYSTALNRRYFLEVFNRIGQRLPEVVSTFDHNQLEDELRLVPEPRTDEGYISPLLYRYRPGFWQGEGLEPLPTLYGQQGAPLRLLPRPTMPTSPFLPVPGGFRIDSGASDLFSSMYDQLRPPVARMFRQRVPARFRIGALGASTIVRRINQLFGPMPVDYNDYWLSGAGEAGGFYSHGQQGPTSRDRGGLAATATGRTISGGTRGAARWTRDETSTDTGGGTGQPSGSTSQTSDTVDVQAQSVRMPMPMSGPVPLPLLGIIPWNMFNMGEGTGIHRARQEFHYENAETTTETTPPGGPTTSTTQQTGGRTRGLLDTYARIARESQTDMLLFVAGEHVPELRGPPSATGEPGAVTQPGSDRLKSRLYFVTREGDVYQLAYGLDTQAQLLNYLYAGANTQQWLAGVRAVGRQMLTGDSAAGGFDGAAVGFTVPRSGGDTFSALALGQLVRSMSDMTPVHVEQAVGMAVTNLLADHRQRDVYASFYRGAQTVTVDQADHSHITDSNFAEGTGEIMWRRVRIDPMAYQAEVRAVGGYPLTVGARGRVEWRDSRYRTSALGLTAAYSNLDLLREFRAADSGADQVYARVHQMLVSFYGWHEDEARDTGYLVSGSYLYARMEDWTVRNPDGSYTTTPQGPEGNPEQHFASAMLMYWAQRHGILMGAQRVPGWSRIYERIDHAMQDIQRNPQNEAQILSTLSTALRQDLNRDIWRFALGYGYDGERVRVYTVAGGQWTGDETAYGNLYGLFLFGRPVRGYADILGHAYGYSPLVISEGTTPGQFDVRRGRYSPYVDLYTGFGLVDWPSVSLNRYERVATVRRTVNTSGALRDVYRELGGAHNTDRLRRLYGEQFVAVAEEGREGFSWMVRPRREVAATLERLRRDEDPVAMSIANLRRDDPAGALIDIFTELRKANPDRERLERQYSRELVSLVELHSVDLDWVLLPPERLAAELSRRAQRSGSVEARLTEQRLQMPPATDDLTGPEVKRLVEQNMLDVLAAATDASARVGLSPERYDVLLGSHLGSPEGQRHRGRTFYVLHTPVAARGDARGSLVIGDETDLDEWIRHGHEIGRGISRLEIAREGDNYNFTFSGDRRLRAFTAERVVGGVSIPITSEGYDRYMVEHNWTVGGLMHVLQDHRLDLLGGAMYGTRQFGNERWQEWTVTFSGRLQGTMTATVSDQWFGYVFFNSTNKQIVFASNDVFHNADELRSVCQQMGGASCTNLTELSRMTGGAGLTWARADLVTGDRFSFHLFFEGGAESYQNFGAAGTTGTTGTTGAASLNRDSEFVFRAGLGFDWTRQSERSVIPNRYFLNISGARGTWPLFPGEITRPEYLNSWEQSIGGTYPGWFIMAHGGFQW